MSSAQETYREQCRERFRRKSNMTPRPGTNQDPHTIRIRQRPSINAWKPASNDDAGVAQILIAVDQVDLPHSNQPALVFADEAVGAPAREKARPVNPELADQEIRP